VAAVLGHEIAHNVASHAAERASQGFILIGIAILAAVFIDMSTSLSNILLELGFARPNSRKQEVSCESLFKESGLT
jgi:metalloendopeptidase OMA1, mitochondrial